MTACTPVTNPPYTDGTGPRVAVVGSSITYLPAGYLAQYAKRDGYRISVSVTFDGSGWQHAAAYAPTHPDVLLVEYGTNGPVETFAAGFNMVQSSFPATCVVWVSVQDHRPQAADPNVDMAAWNARQHAMNDLIYSTPHVADWDAEIAAHIDPATGYSTRLVADQIHPGSLNAPVLAGIEWAGVRACPALRDAADGLEP